MPRSVALLLLCAALLFAAAYTVLPANPKHIGLSVAGSNELSSPSRNTAAQPKSAPEFNGAPAPNRGRGKLGHGELGPNIDLSQYATAIQALTETLQDHPDNGSALANRGRLLVYSGYTGSGRRDLAKARSVDARPMTTAWWALSIATDPNSSRHDLAEAAAAVRAAYSVASNDSGLDEDLRHILRAAVYLEAAGQHVGICDAESEVEWGNAVQIARRRSSGTIVTQPVRVNELDYLMVGAGIHHYRMLLDTGSDMSAATVGAFQGRVLRTGLRRSAHVADEIWGVTDVDGEIGRCPPLFLGGELLVSSEAIWLPDLDLRRATGIPWVDGSIGTNHLQGMSITVRQFPPEITMSTCPNTDLDWEHVAELVRVPDDLRLHVVASIHGLPETLVIDTGSAWAVSTGRSREAGEVREIVIGDATCAISGDVAYSDRFPSLGAAFLNQFDYCIDYIGMRLMLRTPRSVVIGANDRVQSGFSRK